MRTEKNVTTNARTLKRHLQKRYKWFQKPEPELTLNCEDQEITLKLCKGKNTTAEIRLCGYTHRSLCVSPWGNSEFKSKIRLKDKPQKESRGGNAVQQQEHLTIRQAYSHYHRQNIALV